MFASVSTSPQFRRGQMACFIGGQGVIKNYQSESGGWSYLIEMEMATNSEIGRIGYETMVYLAETDLIGLAENCN